MTKCADCGKDEDCIGEYSDETRKTTYYCVPCLLKRGY